MNRVDALCESLAEVYSGAERIDAEAVLDHLADRGYGVTRKPMRRVDHSDAPVASTRRLPKQVHV